MKRIILISTFLLSSLIGFSQAYSTINDVKNDIIAKIIPNDTRAITPVVMQKILLGLVNFKLDTAFTSHDTLFLKRSTNTVVAVKLPGNKSIAGFVGGGGLDDPMAGISLYTNNKLVGLGPKLQIFIDEFPLQNYGINSSFVFDPVLGTINISPNVFVNGSSLRIYLNQ